MADAQPTSLELVCPRCHADLRPCLVEVGTGVTLYRYYAFDEQDGMFYCVDDEDSWCGADERWWECRDCGGRLFTELQEYLDSHSRS